MQSPWKPLCCHRSILWKTKLCIGPVCSLRRGNMAPHEDPGKEDRQFLQQSSQDHWEHQVAPSCFKRRAIYAQTLTCSLPPHSHPPHPLIWPHPQCATLTSNGGPILFRPKSGGLEEAARWVPNQMAGENQRSPEARCHFGGRRKAGTRSPVVELVNLIGSTHDDPKPIF